MEAEDRAMRTTERDEERQVDEAGRRATAGAAPAVPAAVAALAMLALVLGACAGAPPPAPARVETRAGVAYLVRHAETEGAGQERSLSAEGRARARALADRLEAAGIERILVSENAETGRLYPRTRETAAPLAARLGLDLEPYDPRRLAELAAALRAAGGTVLVVGHSNTTPELIGHLGGAPGPPIAEDEHDRLYRVELPSGATDLVRVDPAAEGGDRRPGGGVAPAARRIWPGAGNGLAPAP